MKHTTEINWLNRKYQQMKCVCVYMYVGMENLISDEKIARNFVYGDMLPQLERNLLLQFHVIREHMSKTDTHTNTHLLHHYAAFQIK